MAHRPTVLEDPQVGHDRYQLYKASIDQYQKALKDGYFLECITLMESLIKDRLESRVNGTLTIESEIGVGTKATVYIPKKELL